jgi:LacI family transcriptional regulator
MAAPLHVALLIETSLAYGRGLLRGVARYIHEHGPWSVYFRPQGLDAPSPRWLTRWRGDGILARINDRKMARAVLRTGLPAVDLRAAVPGLKLPGIGPDNRLIAQLVWRHFCDAGFEHFAFCGAPRGQNWFLDIRHDQFHQLVEQSGRECHAYQPRPSERGGAAWEQEQERLARWLRKMPKPIGIMACDDDHGLDVLDACLRAGLSVPDQVAVVGVNNDESLCNLSNPPLSSVDVNHERIGYEAAALLDRMMAGAEPPKEVREFPPRGLAVRQSSDVIGVDDEQVAAALRYIRAHAGEMIGVSHVANAVDVSRSKLERRFVKLLGRTPKQELLRVQLGRARELLTHTMLTIPTVARKAGFQSAGYFHDVFRRRVGCTPGDYRRNHGVLRLGPPDLETIPESSSSGGNPATGAAQGR